MEPEPSIDADIPAPPQESTPEPENGTPERKGLDGCAIVLILFVLLDACGACGVVCAILTNFMPLWGALLLGIPLGLLGLYLLVNLSSGGRIDSMDFMVTQVYIIVLAVITVPVFIQARSKARQTACFQNLHAIGSGLLLYAQDWDDTFPLAARWGDAAAGKVNPELARTMFHCAEAHSAYGYGFNINLDRLPVPKPIFAEQTVMLFEANASSRNAAGDRSLVAHPARHLGTDSYAFADGHTKAIKADTELQWTVQP
jgi:hypothetical protein